MNTYSVETQFLSSLIRKCSSTQPPPLSSFNFVIEVGVKIALSSYENGNTGICSGKSLSDLECADNLLLLSKDSSKLQIFLDNLNGSVGVLGFVFLAPLTSTWCLVINQRSSVLSSSGTDITPWLRNMTVGSKIYMRVLLVFQHGSLYSVGRLWFQDFMSNSEIRRMLLSSSVQCWKQTLNQNRWWLEYVSRTTIERLPSCMLSFVKGNGWRMVPGDQSMTEWKYENYLIEWLV